MKLLRLFILACLMAAAAAGAEPTVNQTPEPLKFKEWKEQQIREAQNEVLRISARLHQQKANPKMERPLHHEDDLLTSSRFERAPDVTERDLRSALDSLALAKQLTLQEYAEVYVSNLQQDPEQFDKLMDSLSKDEISQIMKILVKNKAETDSDAKRSSGLSPSTVAVSASHS